MSAKGIKKLVPLSTSLINLAVFSMTSAIFDTSDFRLPGNKATIFPLFKWKLFFLISSLLRSLEILCAKG